MRGCDTPKCRVNSVSFSKFISDILPPRMAAHRRQRCLRSNNAMKIHEYQAKELLKKFNVPVPRGIVARSAEEAYQAAKELASEVVVVKAQIHAGGRGKGGGVKLAKTADEARDLASKMLGMKLVTHQTGPEGREVRVQIGRASCRE